MQNGHHDFCAEKILVHLIIIKFNLAVETSVTRFGEISPFWKIFKVLGNFLRVYFLFGKILDRLMQILYAIGQVFIDVNGQMLEIM